MVSCALGPRFRILRLHASLSLPSASFCTHPCVSHFALTRVFCHLILRTPVLLPSLAFFPLLSDPRLVASHRLVARRGSPFRLSLSGDGDDASSCLLLDHVPHHGAGVVGSFDGDDNHTWHDQDQHEWHQLLITVEIPDVACERYPPTPTFPISLTPISLTAHISHHLRFPAHISQFISRPHFSFDFSPHVSFDFSPHACFDFSPHASFDFSPPNISHLSHRPTLTGLILERCHISPQRTFFAHAHISLRCSIHLANPRTDAIGEVGAPSGSGCAIGRPFQVGNIKPPDPRVGAWLFPPEPEPCARTFYSCTQPLRISGRVPRAEYKCEFARKTGPFDWPVSWHGDGGDQVAAAARDVYRREIGKWALAPIDVSIMESRFPAETDEMEVLVLADAPRRYSTISSDGTCAVAAGASLSQRAEPWEVQQWQKGQVEVQRPVEVQQQVEVQQWDKGQVRGDVTAATAAATAAAAAAAVGADGQPFLWDEAGATRPVGEPSAVAVEPSAAGVEADVAKQASAAAAQPGAKQRQPTAFGKLFRWWSGKSREGARERAAQAGDAVQASQHKDVGDGSNRRGVALAVSAAQPSAVSGTAGTAAPASIGADPAAQALRGAPPAEQAQTSASVIGASLGAAAGAVGGLTGALLLGSYAIRMRRGRVRLRRSAAIDSHAKP